MCSSVCEVYSRAEGPVTAQPVFLVYRPRPIFGWGRALKHVWNSWIETESETEIERRAQREAENTRLLQICQVSYCVYCWSLNEAENKE